MRLADLAGQDHAVALLQRTVAGGRLAHALLFDGPEGVGKRSAALGVALALCCPVEPARGCGTCDVCRRILEGQHPDVQVLRPEGTQFVIDQAKEVVALASTRPHEAPARVIVLEKADTLNANAANCLLKTLEEPFPGTHMVLVTAAPDRLLPTIRSRTQRIRFVALPPAVLVKIALRRGVSQAQAEIAAAMAGGSAARLCQLLEAEAENNLWQVVTNFREAAGAAEVGPIFDAAGAFSDKESREDLPEILTLLARFYRDALALAAGADELVLLRDRMAEMEGLVAGGESIRVRRLRRAVSAVLATRVALASNVNAVTALEKMMMDIRTSRVESA
jgi:DNA polymerase-3 subunit delta'